MIRRFSADTFSMIVFTTITGMIIEVFISGMTFNQSAQARLIAVPINLISARPYGIFRDRVFLLFSVNKNNKKQQYRKILADILAFVSFQIPIYFSILVISGARFHQIIIACSIITILSVFIGRPYGIFLEFSRRIFKVNLKSTSY